MVVGAAGFVLIVAGSLERQVLLLTLGGAPAFAVGRGWNGLFNLAVVQTHPGAPASSDRHCPDWWPVAEPAWSSVICTRLDPVAVRASGGPRRQ